MNAYIDTSVVLRIAFNEPNSLAAWTQIRRGFSSELITVEALRSLDRIRVVASLDERELAERRASILALIHGLELVAIDRSILVRAAEPFPTSLGTLDAIHLATAVALQAEVDDLVLATHDERLALAATAMGLAVER